MERTNIEKHLGKHLFKIGHQPSQVVYPSSYCDPLLHLRRFRSSEEVPLLQYVLSPTD